MAYLFVMITILSSNMPAEGVGPSSAGSPRKNARSKADFPPTLISRCQGSFSGCRPVRMGMLDAVGLAVIRFREAAVQPTGVATHRSFKAEAGL